MSWSWPPHFVHYFDGAAGVWVDTNDFETYDAAEAFARSEFSQDDLDDGLVVIVPVVDPAEAVKL